MKGWKWLFVVLAVELAVFDCLATWRFIQVDRKAKYLEDYIWVLENRIAATNGAVEVAYESIKLDRKWLLAEIDKKAAK